MHPLQISVLQNSYALFPSDAVVEQTFWSLLNVEDPSAATVVLDAAEAGEDLFGAITAAVRAAATLEKQRKPAYALAEKLVKRGLKPDKYPAIGRALLATAKACAVDPSDKVLAAWADLWAWLEETMLAAAKVEQKFKDKAAKKAKG